jgi:ankyrin repeat domain-containing protein 13
MGKVHEFIWRNQAKELDELLTQCNEPEPDRTKGVKEYHKGRQQQLVNKTFRGVTPLAMAAQMGQVDCTKVLLKHEADTTITSSLGFYPLQDAISTGNREICRMVMEKRFFQVSDMVQIRTPFLYSQLPNVPDVYVEVDWKFFSWIPFLSNFCPRDTCRIWKRGNWVRFDMSLVGLEKYTFQYGEISFIFKIDSELIVFWVVDHQKKLVEKFNPLKINYTAEEIESDLNLNMRMELICAKLKRSNLEETERIKFIPQKSGWFGGGGDFEEDIAGYHSRVFDIKNIMYLSLTRREHLKLRGKTLDIPDLDEQPPQEEDLQDTQTNENQEDAPQPNDANIGYIEKMKNIRREKAESLPSPPKPSISFEEYFQDAADKPYVHLGRPLDIKTKKKSLTGQIWMADNFPLKTDQILPLLELISPSSKHFEKLCDFVSCDLPDGFPIRLQVPIFMVLSAQASFSKIKLLEKEEIIGEDETIKPKTIIRDDIFTIPNEEDGYIEGIVIKNVLKED